MTDHPLLARYIAAIAAVSRASPARVGFEAVIAEHTQARDALNAALQPSPAPVEREARAIDRLECTRGRDCQCTEPEEAWICRYSHLPAKPPVEWREAVAIAICESTLWPGAWARANEVERDNWLHNADAVLRALAKADQIAGIGGAEDAIERAYKQGWNDREDDLIAGVNRVYPQGNQGLSHSQPNGAPAFGAATEGHGDRDWRPMTQKPPEVAGAYINVRSVTTYRWLPYKPDGARQMKKAGRWQAHDGYGFTNAALPENADWRALSSEPSAATEGQGDLEGGAS